MSRKLQQKGIRLKISYFIKEFKTIRFFFRVLLLGIYVTISKHRSSSNSRYVTRSHDVAPGIKVFSPREPFTSSRNLPIHLV